MVFLATPHKGADVAETLKKILLATVGSREYINDLLPSSSLIQAINDEFPYHCEDLELRSFFETRKTAFGTKRTIIVSKESATLNYRNERTSYMDADHRDVCKFASQQDRNYLLVRDSLAKLLEDLKLAPGHLKRKETDYERRHWLKAGLDVDESVEEDFLSVDALRMPGTCLWITKKETYCSWLGNPEPQIYWLAARPGTGKSVLSGFVINSLKEEGFSCSFYFLRSGDHTRLSIATLLRSIAWQMSFYDPGVFEFLQKVCRRDPQLGKAEYRTVWRKIFLDGIFRMTVQRPQYWIIDAIDECKSGSELVPLLLKAAEIGGIHVFITSRKPIISYIHPVPSRPAIISATVEPDDTKVDIQLFLTKNLRGIPALTTKIDAPNSVEEIIWTKSSGCFLWVHLVLSELRQVHTTTEVIEVLESVPSDMTELYGRILDSMSRMPYGIRLAKAILSWTACATRPLTIEELHFALEIDMNDTVNSVPEAIESTCGQLVYVDTTLKVHMVHQTAREFLLGLDNKSDFAISRKEGHKRLGMVCLKYLNGNQMVAQHRKLSVSRIPRERSAFVSYASKSLSTHISFSSSRDDELLEALSKFLSSSNVLSWIEYIANSSDLGVLIKTGNSLKDYSRRRTRNVAPFEQNVRLVKAWSIDLVRIATKFGKNLLSYPSSVYHLIPPFCPSESAIKKQFANSARSISVNGLSAAVWDDCLSTIIFQQERPTALARSKKIFAVGLSDGKIKIYDESTYQSLYTLNHSETIQLLKFGDNRNLLVSASRKSILVWKLESREMLWKFELQSPSKVVSFFDDDTLLLVMLTSSRLLLWDLETGIERNLATWLDDIDEQYSDLGNSPAAVAMMDDFTNASTCPQLIAVAYRGVEVFLWDIEGEIMYDVYSQQLGSRGAQAIPCIGVGPAWTLTFSHVLDPPLLAVGYNDGQLVVFNTSDGSVQATALVNAQRITSSPNGLMLACGNFSSTISVFDFEKLTLLYRIDAENHAIQSLVFSEDSHRLIDIRGQYCQVWDPPVLICEGEDDEQRSDTISVSTVPQEVTFNDSRLLTHITDYVMASDSENVFCGKSDGNVYVYDSKQGQESRILLRQTHDFPIYSLLYSSENSILVSTDLSYKVMVHKLRKDRTEWNVTDTILEENVDNVVEQVLLNANCSLLLTSSEQRDSLWSLDHAAKEIATIFQNGQKQRRWCLHPLDPDVIILVSGEVAHLYQFHTLNRLTPEKGISMLGSFPQNSVIHSIVPCFNDKVIATTYSDSPYPPSKSKLLLWISEDLTEGSTSAAAVPHYQPLADNIECLMGAYGKRLVFLHRDGWVCSAEAQTFDVENLDRHFFLPSDWLSTVGGPMAKVFSNGCIIIARGEELAIIRKGLDCFENGQSREPSSTRSSFSKRSSTLTRRFASVRTA